MKGKDPFGDTTSLDLPNVKNLGSNHVEGHQTIDWELEAQETPLFQSKQNDQKINRSVK
jgi:hypothetical protein